MSEGLDISQYSINNTILKQMGEHVKSLGGLPGIDLKYLFDAPNDPTPISKSDFEALSDALIDNNHKLVNAEGDCRDRGVPMLGWLTLPEKIDDNYLDRISSLADNLADEIDAFVSLGIGGSYLGIEATWKALIHNYWNQLSREERGGRPEIYFLGQNMDPDFFRDTLDILEGKRIGVNVISKSGTTTETAIAFRLIKDLMVKSFGSKSKDLILATTDKKKGSLRYLAEKEGYKTLVVPDDIGGRFSIITDVGLFGLAVAGIDIHSFVAGFKVMKKATDSDDFWQNQALLHAAARHCAYTKGKKIEVVASNSVNLYHITRWMEQLFPESEGHNGKGMWVSPSMYSEKLHANGQMIQEGERNIFETFLALEESDNHVKIPFEESDLDGLNYLPEGSKDFNYMNRFVIEGPAYAHYNGGVPNITIKIPAKTPFNLGALYFMLERSTALSGYLLGHNPFIQPGVEAYKKAIFALAGKPGYESAGARIKERINSIK